MTNRSFIKALLATPLVSLAETTIPEQKYGFNFIGDKSKLIPIKNTNPIDFLDKKFSNHPIGLVTWGIVWLKFGDQLTGQYVPQIEKCAMERIKSKNNMQNFIETYWTNSTWQREMLEKDNVFYTASMYMNMDDKYRKILESWLIENKLSIKVFCDYKSFKNFYRVESDIIDNGISVEDPPWSAYFAPLEIT